jgi:16S rRNA (cytidine1402-2'-O)-methyltransferase
MQSPKHKTGTLYVVATPIGNLQDITLRAIEVLKKVDKIAAEDTRHSAQLLKHFAINKPTISLHDFNERERLQEVLESLLHGEAIALISDAGTPLISDPGYRLVKEAKELGIEVLTVPGSCAAIAALSVAGLASDRFVFEGFLPAKQEARHQCLLTLVHESRTIIFYEAPHRLMPCLQSLVEVFGPTRRASVARELTKLYESVITLTLAELAAYYQAHPQEQKGEIVILVEGKNSDDQAKKEVNVDDVLAILLTELPLKQAVALAAKITGERKNILYEKALNKQKNDDL